VSPTELTDEAAASLLDFLYQLAEALERHYAGQLLRYAHDRGSGAVPPDPPDNDPPF
jgi:hypothetical protein